MEHEQKIDTQKDRKSSSLRTLIIVLIIGLASGTLGTWLMLRGGQSGSSNESATGTVQYQCPMHPTIIQDHPGDCPLCGMKLLPVKDGKDDAAESESDSGPGKYSCPMDPEIVQDHPGECPLCGMDLVKMKGSEERTTDGPRKILFYRSPMDPNVTSHEPRKDEMGMDFIPVYEDEANGSAASVQGRAAVTIDPARQQLIGLRTAAVTPGDVSGGWRTVGRVQVDPTRVSRINVKVSGYVERVFVDFVGRPIRKGEALFTIYSPDLLAAQQEFLLALQTRNSYAQSGGLTENGEAMVAAARQKLKLWDVPDAELKRLEETGEATKTLTFVSPVSGVVTTKNIVDGTALKPGDMPYEITDLSTVWVLADAYQSDVEQLDVGMPATLTLESLPDQVFTGKIEFVDPILDPQTRTLKVRLNFENKAGELKPDMYGEVTFQNEARKALTIPADAVIPSGRGHFVFVDIGGGKFQPRPVEIGAKSGDHVEVISGLNEGEKVVTRANFLVDSESSLRAALAAIGE